MDSEQNCDHDRLHNWWSRQRNDEMAMHIETVVCSICGQEFSAEVHNYGGEPFLMAAGSAHLRNRLSEENSTANQQIGDANTEN